MRFGASDGQLWRVHRVGLGAWYFSSIESHDKPADVGRFDLPAPMGTCYVGYYDDAVAMEVLSLSGLTPAQMMQAVSKRSVSAMAMDAFYDKPIADFTSSAAATFGAPERIERLERHEARPWAQAAWAGGFHGILYRLRKDPDHRNGFALFGSAGPREKPASQGPPQPFVVGQMHVVADLASRPFTGDPLAE